MRLVLLGLICFEVFSFASSREAGFMMFGDLKAGPITWATLIAIGICLLDFGALARLIMPEEVAREIETWRAPLFLAWVLSACFDTYLTYFAVVNKMAVQELPVLVTAGIMTSDFYLKTVPIGFAILIWVIQVLLVTRLGSAADQVVRDRGNWRGGSAPKKPKPSAPVEWNEKDLHDHFLRRLNEETNRRGQ